MDLETSKMKEKRLKRIENKYEYVNMICADLTGLMGQQSDCIRHLDGNYAKGVSNTERAKEEVSNIKAYKDKHDRTTCVVILFVILLAILTVFFMKTHLVNALLFKSSPQAAITAPSNAQAKVPTPLPPASHGDGGKGGVGQGVRGAEESPAQKKHENRIVREKQRQGTN